MGVVQKCGKCGGATTYDYGEEEAVCINCGQRSCLISGVVSKHINIRKRKKGTHTRIVRETIDRAKSESVEGFLSAYAKSLHESDSRVDSYVETMVEFTSPQSLITLIRQWTGSIMKGKDSAFKRGAIYSLYRIKDYLTSVEDADPTES